MKPKLFNPIFRGFLIFTVLLSGWFVFSMANAVKAFQTNNWPQTQGIVLSSGIEKQSSSKGPGKYIPVIRYSYAVGLNNYISKRYSPSILTGTALWAKQIADSYPEKTTVTVYYQPAKPENSTLVTGLHSSDYWMLIFSSASLSLLVVFFKKQLQKKEGNEPLLLSGNSSKTIYE